MAASTAAIAQGMMRRRQCPRGQVVRAVRVRSQHPAGREVGLGNALAAPGEVRRVVLLGRLELGHELPGEPEGIFDYLQHRVVHGPPSSDYYKLPCDAVAIPMVETTPKQREWRAWVGCKAVHEQSVMVLSVMVSCRSGR